MGRSRDKGAASGSRKGGKDSQLLIRIASEERAAFVRLCEELDTTAAREIRRFIREFTARHGRSGDGPAGGAADGGSRS
jgi:hypothetical protein